MRYDTSKKLIKWFTGIGLTGLVAVIGATCSTAQHDERYSGMYTVNQALKEVWISDKTTSPEDYKRLEQAIAEYNQAEGKNIQLKKGAGLHWKFPVLGSVKYIDMRYKQIDTAPEKINTVDKRRLMTDMIIGYKVYNPLLFYLKNNKGDFDIAETNIEKLARDARNRQIAQRDQRQVLHTEPTEHENVEGEESKKPKEFIGREQIAANIHEQLKEEAKDIGVEIVYFRFKSVDFPPEVEQQILTRMVSEREKERDAFKAEGAEIYDSKKAEVDRKVKVMEADAEKKAKELRGEGDAEAQHIYNEAYKVNPEFYDLWMRTRIIKELGPNAVVIQDLDDSEIWNTLHAK